MNKSQFIKITNWQNKTFGKASAISKINHLQEEVEELRIALAFINEKDIKNEFADCFLLLFGAANSAGFSYEEICKMIDEKMKINYKRKWGEPKENGVVNHIKE